MSLQETVSRCDVGEDCWKTHFSFETLSLESLPASEVGFEYPALPEPNSPSSPRRIIFRGKRTGAGELLLGVLAAMLDKDGGILQKGVLKMRTAPAAASYECVMW